jgi:hypothetical protein
VNVRVAFLGAILLTAALAACGGGGGGGGGGNHVIPTTAPTATPVGGPTTVTSTVTLGAAQSVAFSVAGVTGTANIPAGSGTVTVTISTTPNPTQLDLKHRLAQNPANTPVVYIAITSTGNATIDAFPGFTVNGLSGTGNPYFLAWFFNGGQQPAWTSTTETGHALSGTTLAIPTLAIPTPIAINAANPMQLALYSGNYIPPINIFGCVGGNASPPPAGSAIERPALTGVHPITNGDNFPYTGTMVQTISRTQPCPQPTTTASATVTLDVTTSGTTETSIETDTFPLQTSGLTTVANVSETTGTPMEFLESSETATDINGNAIATTYNSPGLIYAELPDTNGAMWSNNAPKTVNQTINDGETIDRTYGANGTYTEVDTLPGGNGTNTVTLNADGSGSYAIGMPTPAPGVPPPPPLTTFSFSAPSGGTIALTINGSPSGTIPVWFTPTNTFYTDSTVDMGEPVNPSGLPQGCDFPFGGLSLSKIVRTIVTTDPILGFIETETITSFDASGATSIGTSGGTETIGPVCSIITDTQAEYYDYSLNTPFGLFFTSNGTPVLTTTVNEMLSLSQDNLNANVVHRATASAQLSAQIDAQAAGIRFTRAVQRAQTMEKFAAFVRAAHTTGGLK